MKIRFLEPGNRPYKPTPLNYFVYDRYIRTPLRGTQHPGYHCQGAGR